MKCLSSPSRTNHANTRKITGHLVQNQKMEPDLKYSTQVKPISYFKSHAAELVQQLAQGGEPLILTLNGEAKAIVQGMATFERMCETMALLKILALGNKQIEAGQTHNLDQAMSGLREIGNKE